MVNYTLGIYNSSFSKILDMSLILDKGKLKSLESLDKFTQGFTSEQKLIEHLIGLGYLGNDCGGKVSIVYKYKDKIHKLPVIYSDSIKYFNVDFIRNKLRDYSNNLEFLNRLANHYDTRNGRYKKQDMNVSDIRYYLSEIKNNYDNDLYILLDESLEDLFRKAVFSFNKDYKSCKLYYRGLRDLALFIYNYEKVETLKLIKDKITRFSEEINTRSINYNEVVLGENNDEPYFAPNSKEEIMYNEYMSMLSTMEPEIPIEKKYYK